MLHSQIARDTSRVPISERHDLRREDRSLVDRAATKSVSQLTSLQTSVVAGVGGGLSVIGAGAA